MNNKTTKVLLLDDDPNLRGVLSDILKARGFEEVETEHARRGALLHDIGKIAIPDSILLKPGPLDDREWSVLRQHPQYAYNLLSPITYLRPRSTSPGAIMKNGTAAATRVA